MRVRLVGADPHPKIIGLDKLKGRSNYFVGNDPKKWRTNVPNYARVMVKDVYPGIDMVYRGQESEVRSQESGLRGHESGVRSRKLEDGLEFDFVVHPGADPNAIRLAAETGNWTLENRSSKIENRKWKLETRNSKLETSPDGDLALRTDAGEVRFGKAVVYQAATDDEQRARDAAHSELRAHNSELVGGDYVLTANNELRFEVGTYDPSKTLVIDPTLNFIATFGGSNGDSQGQGIAVDSAGNAYVAGMTLSTGFTTTPGSFEPTPPFNGGAFVLKIDPSGAVVYSTYLAGSSGDDWAFGVAVDSSGDAYVTGLAVSTDFPVFNAFQPTCAPYVVNGESLCGDAFVTELNPAGSALVYSSYLGGSANQPPTQSGYGIAVDAAGSAYVAGITASADFPTTPNGFQPAFGGGQCGGSAAPFPCSDAFVTKVAPGGSPLVYSSFLGGSGPDYASAIAIDAGGNAYVAGTAGSFNFPVLNAFQAACVPRAMYGTCENAFVTEVNATGSALVFSTYLGGSGDNGDHAYGIGLDPTGDIYITGVTSSPDFPLANAYDSSGPGWFVTEFNPGASKLVYSTYFPEETRAIAVDSLGEAYITGLAASDLPLVNPVQSAYGGGESEAFITGFEAGGGGLIYSTFLGGVGTSAGFGISADPAGNIWATGVVNSAQTLPSVRRRGVAGRETPPRPLQTTTPPNQGFGGSIGLDMARVHATPASLDFGAQVAGTTGAAQTVTVSNPGTAPLTFSGISASEGFTVPSGGSCSTSASVAPGGSCTVDVAFAPTVGGNLTGTLTLTDDGIGSPHSVPLSGIGQDFTLVTNQSSATLKAGVTATILLSVAPEGGFNHSLDLSCDDPAPLSTCSINPASVTPNPASGATVAVSITTTAASQIAPRGPNGPPPGPWDVRARHGVPLLLAMLALLAGAAALRSNENRRARCCAAGAVECGSASYRPGASGLDGGSFAAALQRERDSFWTGRPRRAPLRWLLVLGLLLVLAWAACGGGTAGTPAGTYTVSIKAADTQANLSHSTTVTLTVNP